MKYGEQHYRIRNIDILEDVNRGQDRKKCGGVDLE